MVWEIKEKSRLWWDSFGKSSWERTELNFEGFGGSESEGRGSGKRIPPLNSVPYLHFWAHLTISASAAAISCKPEKSGSIVASGALTSTGFLFLASLLSLPAGTCSAILIHRQTWKYVDVNTKRATLDHQGAEARGLILPSSTLQVANS